MVAARARSTTPMALSEEPREKSPGVSSISFSASRVTSSELKRYLDRKYPGQYSVKLKRDEFTVTIMDQVKENLQ
ncbi:hypothetical protein GGR54DRAFT_618748 [Hypoxylon sp. NC1633]|nr:hypothetical protein GGR54DRAFT_618748 [Hypoxylon sp. NC1633]